MVNLWRASHTGFFGDFLALGCQLWAWEWRAGSAKRPQTAGFFRLEKSRWKGGGAVQPVYLLLCSVPLFLRKYFKK